MTYNRWKCGHCGAEGWGNITPHDKPHANSFIARSAPGWGNITPHDKPHGVACRKSGQLSECEISRKLRSEYAMEDRIAKARGETKGE